MAPWKCVSCGQQQPILKVIRCLHRVCLDCVTRITNGDGAMVCPRCKVATGAQTHGKRQQVMLPLVVNSLDAAEPVLPSQAAADVPSCERCGEEDEKPAEMFCVNCEERFCGHHSKEHAKAKATKMHDQVELNWNASASSPAPSAPCPWHGIQLTHYCTHCSELACKQCLDGDAHKKRACHVATMEDAARQVKADLGDESARGSSKACLDTLNAYLLQIHASIQDLEVQAKDRSEEITREFQVRMDAMKKRQETLLGDVANHLAAKQRQLFEQVERLTVGIEDCENLIELPAMCLGDCNLLRLSPWLKEKASALQKTGKKDQKPCVRCKMVFHPAHCVEPDDIGRMGVIYDAADVDTSKSVVTCTPTASAQSDFVIQVILRNREDNDIDLDGPVYAGLDIRLTKDADSSSRTPSTSSTGSRSSTPSVASSFAVEAVAAATISSELLSPPVPISQPEFKAVRHHTDKTKWVCRPELFGSYTVVVKCGQTEVGGSPLHVKVMEDCDLHTSVTFDATVTDRALSLTDRNLVVASQDKFQRSAYSKVLKTGCYHLRLKCITSMNCSTGDQFPLIGIVPAFTTPQRDHFLAEGRFTGLSAGKGVIDGRDVEKESASGKVVNWGKVSSITMLINLDTRKLTIQFCQSDGAYIVTWSNIPEEVRVRVGLYWPGTQISILTT